MNQKRKDTILGWFSLLIIVGVICLILWEQGNRKLEAARVQELERRVEQMEILKDDRKFCLKLRRMSYEECIFRLREEELCALSK